MNDAREVNWSLLRPRLSRGAWTVAWVWAATRLVLLGTALVAAMKARTSFDAAVGNWDVLHFANVAQHGYAQSTEMAFFPGVPLLLRPAENVGAPLASWGLVVSLLASIVATAGLYRLGGTWAAVAWLLAPTSIFTVVAYSEAPFCAAAFWAWERATKRQWGQAAALAGAACLFRVSGLFLTGALAVLMVTTLYAQGWRQVVAALRWLLVPVGVLFGYVFYLFSLTGSWTAWFAAQSAGWGRGFTWPWDCLAHHWAAIQPGLYAAHPEWQWVFRAELVSWVLGLVVTAWLLYRRKLASASWVGVQVLAFSLSFWLQSVCRAVLLWFPLWTELGSFVESHRCGGWRGVWAAALGVGVALQVTWAFMFCSGMWAS